MAWGEKGIAHVVNDLRNPRLCDPKAGALPGCATPRHVKAFQRDRIIPPCICSLLCPMIFMAVIVSTTACLNLVAIQSGDRAIEGHQFEPFDKPLQRPFSGSPTVSRYTGTLVECLGVVPCATQRMCRNTFPTPRLEFNCLPS